MCSDLNRREKKIKVKLGNIAGFILLIKTPQKIELSDFFLVFTFKVTLIKHLRPPDLSLIQVVYCKKSALSSEGHFKVTRDELGTIKRN